MADERYLNITIGGNKVQVKSPEDIPISVDYSLEDPDNFQKKKSAESFNVKIPANPNNDKLANTFWNPDINDLTSGEIFRSHQPAIIEAGGQELLVGKAFLVSASHTNRPQEYEFNFYGDNADWLVDLKETTLYDFLKHINFTFNQANIINSWVFDGTNEALPYVFAPVRYRDKFDPVNEKDDDTAPIYMKPSISKYWILYWAFKSLGYKIQSNFFNLPYFRRQVMPWTWGSFLSSEGTRFEIHKFRAKSLQDVFYEGSNGSINIIWDLMVSDDYSPGMFDNNNTVVNGDYTYSTPLREMKWKYNTPHYGTLEATFSMNISYDLYSSGNSDVELRVQWRKNGVQFDSGWGAYNSNGNLIAQKSASGVGGSLIEVQELFATALVNPDDEITAKIYLHIFESKVGNASAKANILQFQLDHFRIPLGGVIDFENYTGFKKYKFLDYLRGIVDEFNLSVNTDPVNKVVYFEPTHPYSVGSSLIAAQPGYFKNDFIDWNGKEDLGKEWRMDNYSDYEKEVLFKYKEDSNDGILKKITDRNITTLAAGKYIFPDRFKAGRKEIENRFFSATMHCEFDQWKDITGVAPQLVCLVPENISNTSNSEAANTFQPKSCYYKGNIAGVGGWKFDGVIYATLPFMFAVNYKNGGESDPVLSYSDEKIGANIGYGLLKRYYWQRMAIMRNGQFYNTWFRLKNADVSGQLHREYKSYAGHRWELIQIKDYLPLKESSTFCLLRKWAAVSIEDASNTYPTEDSVQDGTINGDYDIKYAQLKCLTTDIPT